MSVGDVFLEKPRHERMVLKIDRYLEIFDDDFSMVDPRVREAHRERLLGIRARFVAEGLKENPAV
jgi:hypothetical protein